MEPLHIPTVAGTSCKQSFNRCSVPRAAGAAKAAAKYYNQAPKPKKVKIMRGLQPRPINPFDLDLDETLPPAYHYTEYKENLTNGFMKLVTNYTPCDKQQMLNRMKNSKDLQHFFSEQTLLKDVETPAIGAALTIGSIALDEYLREKEVILCDDVPEKTKNKSKNNKQ